MFYFNKEKQRIDERFGAIELFYNELQSKVMELSEKIKSHSERIVILDNRLDKLEAENAKIYKLLPQIQDNIMSEVNPKFTSLENELERNGIDLDRTLMAFRKEMIEEIASKFFDTLDKVFRTSKEISLIATLINTNSTELGQLKSQLLKPYVEAKHREERIKKGEEIVNKGQKIIETRNNLYEEMIEKQRKGENIFNLKFKIEVYDEILKSLK